MNADTAFLVRKARAKGNGMSATETVAGVGERLAIAGGPKGVGELPRELFAWPLITTEDEEAVLEVLLEEEGVRTAQLMEPEVEEEVLEQQPIR